MRRTGLDLAAVACAAAALASGSAAGMGKLPESRVITAGAVQLGDPMAEAFAA